MENDSSRSGYHQPQPASAGHNFRRFREDADEQWDDDIIEESTHSAEPLIKLIWAQAYDREGNPGALGLNGTMPWHLSEDMKAFKDHTITHPVIMGRKTWESLSEKFRPLSNRDNYVISHNPDYVAKGATVVSSLNDAIELASQPAIPDDGVRRDEIWIIGGAQIYSEAINRADEVYITDLDIHVEADAFAPLVHVDDENSLWSEEIIRDWTAPKDTKNEIKRYRFRVLRRA
ncbi:dihydrofolate reductase [Alloscardovia theropitheci]|uniref:dihydrofolate reductase n=1 Tax=Alloscardovia theropitheci TaxID=2496842 RepID=A0A4R0QZJ0_9BIFI|nr:dihydrofolate reductase [Alloscardovia theropitheci]TCD54066.1 dihydrofolate reductase [Alloscardovia theropitheci]